MAAWQRREVAQAGSHSENLESSWDQRVGGHGMMQWIKMLLAAFAAIFAGAVVSAIPLLPRWFEMVDTNQALWLLATGSSAGLGFVLMMGGILALLMAQDRTLSPDDAADVERSVRLAAKPVAWRATSYRVWGRAIGT